MSSNTQDQNTKFPGDDSIAPLSVNKGSGLTQENPGDVHPVNDPSTGHYMPERKEGQQGPSIARSIENPYALQEALTKLQSSLDNVIDLFAGEGSTLSNDGSFEQGKGAIEKFRSWRQELEDIKRGKE